MDQDEYRSLAKALKARLADSTDIPFSNYLKRALGPCTLYDFTGTETDLAAFINGARKRL